MLDEVKQMLDSIEEETNKNPFMKLFNIINEEISKEGQFLDCKKLLETIEDKSLFDDPTLTAGFLQSNNRMSRNINIAKSFAPVNFI